MSRFCLIDTRGLHVLGHHQTGLGRRLTAGAGVDIYVLALDLHHRDGERVRHVGIGELGGDERLLGVVDRGVLDEGGVVRLFPDAVVDRRDLDVADLELLETHRCGSNLPAGAFLGERG